MVQVSPLLLFVGGLRGWAGDKAFLFCRRSDWLSAPTAPYFYFFLLSLYFPSSLISPVHETEKDEMRCGVSSAIMDRVCHGRELGLCLVCKLL